MKTRLGTRTGQKTLEVKPKRHPNMKECSMPKGQFNTFGVPFDTLKGQDFPCGLWPSGLRVMIMHTLFDLSTKDAFGFTS